MPKEQKQPDDLEHGEYQEMCRDQARKAAERTQEQSRNNP
jgi:hypothetical protein